MAVRTVVAPFIVGFDRVMSFGDPKKPAIILTCGQGRQELIDLAHTLAAEGSATAKGSSEPHLTFIYDQKRFPHIVPVEPIIWTANEFVLICSHHGQSRHDQLGRWPLQS